MHGERSSQQKDDQQSDSDVGVHALEHAEPSQHKYDTGSGHGQLVRGHAFSVCVSSQDANPLNSNHVIPERIAH